MAQIANTAFEARITNNRHDDTVNVMGIFYNGATSEDCAAGFLCTRSAVLANEGYTGVNNENAYQMVAAESSVLATTPIYACNSYDTAYAQGADGNLYHVGTRTLGLPGYAGKPCNYTRVNFDGFSCYRFGIGNASATLGTNTYFTIASGLLVPAAAAPTGAAFVPYFKLKATGNFTEGTQSSFGYVDVIACMTAA